MQLTSYQQDFMLHFGEMGSRWGIARTVGQIYAVLFISEEPLNAEQVMQAVGVSRSNVSMGIKELQSWNLIRLKHVPGDRRDYYTTPEDMWEIVRTLIAERKKREIDPTLTKLRELQMQRPEADDYASARVAELHELIESMVSFYDELDKLETDRLVGLLRMGSRLRKLVTGTARVLPLASARKDKG